MIKYSHMRTTKNLLFGAESILCGDGKVTAVVLSRHLFGLGNVAVAVKLHHSNKVTTTSQ
jgi:hypothetical protein